MGGGTRGNGKKLEAKIQSTRLFSLRFLMHRAYVLVSPFQMILIKERPSLISHESPSDSKLYSKILSASSSSRLPHLALVAQGGHRDRQKDPQS